MATPTVTEAELIAVLAHLSANACIAIRKSDAAWIAECQMSPCGTVSAVSSASARAAIVTLHNNIHTVLGTPVEA
jgi:hypothetical protein